DKCTTAGEAPGRRRSLLTVSGLTASGLAGSDLTDSGVGCDSPDVAMPGRRLARLTTDPSAVSISVRSNTSVSRPPLPDGRFGSESSEMMRRMEARISSIDGSLSPRVSPIVKHPWIGFRGVVHRVPDLFVQSKSGMSFSYSSLTEVPHNLLRTSR